MIDDIHYLYKNSVKENIVLLIDSQKRDKKKYRTPSEFTVEFPECFKNVYGVEVLNASIPRTSFTIDTHNNTINLLQYRYGLNEFNNLEISSAFETKSLIPNDYSSADKLLSGLSSLLLSGDDTFVIEANSTALETDVDITTKGYIRLQSRRSPFIINSKESNMSLTIGFTLLSDKLDNDKYLTKEHLLTNRITTFIDKDISNTTHLTDAMIIFATKDDIIVEQDGTNSCIFDLSQYNQKINCGIYILKLSLNDEEIDTNNLNSLFVFNSFKVKNIQLSETYKATIQFNYVMDNSRAIYNLPEDHTFVSKIDNQVINSTEDLTEIEDNSIKIFQSSSTDVFLRKLKVEISEITGTDLSSDMCIELNSIHNTNQQKIYFQMKYIRELDKYYLVYDISEEVNVMNYIKIYDVFYQLHFMKNKNDKIRINILSIDETNTDYYNNLYFRVIPPGILNMVSENFVLLRCPEIENHQRGSYDTNDTSPGLALFSIDVKSGYAANQNEFYSVKYKEFHPIGKLSRMHFRFERRTDRELYDFKGIDLHFFLSIKMFSPSKLNEQNLSYTLNPDYNPNYQGFVASEFDHIESDDEINESKFDDKAYFETEDLLINQRQRHIQRLKNNDTESEYESESESD